MHKLKTPLIILLMIAVVLIVMELGAHIYLEVNKPPLLTYKEEFENQNNISETKYFRRDSVSEPWQQIADIFYSNDGENRITKSVDSDVLGVNTDQTRIDFFGCSFTFGEGLNDDETFPYILQHRTPGYDIVNHAKPGYSTSNMVRIIDSEKVNDQQGIGIYVFIDDHIRRNIGTMQMVADGDSWASIMPYFAKASDGQLVDSGNIFPDSPNIHLYQSLSSLSLLKAFGINLPAPQVSDVSFAADLVVKAQHDYLMKNPNNDFYVLIHPLGTTDYVDEFVHQLEKRGIKYIDGRYFNGIEPGNYYTNPHETTHPNKEINQIIVQGLIESLDLVEW